MDLEIKDQKLIAKTDKEYLFDLVCSNNNLLAIKRALRFLGFDIDFQILKTEPKDYLEKKDIDFLKDKFKDKLVVEE